MLKTPFDGLIALPREVLDRLKTASADELKILIYFFANPDTDTASAAKDTGLTLAQAESACAFWRGAGIFAEAEGVRKSINTDATAYRNYDNETLSKAIESDAEFSMVCSVAGQKLEKQLNKNDYSSLYYLFDFVHIPAAMLCGIIEECVASGKRSMQYIFKKAVGLYDDGVDTYEKYEAYLARREAIRSDIGRLRRLFGIGDRALSGKEQRFFDTWFGEWSLPFELVELAYEKMIDVKGKIALDYMNGILKRWQESGFSSVEDVKSGDVGRSAGNESSFAGDEFIEAALSRGFSDMEETGV